MYVFPPPSSTTPGWCVWPKTTASNPRWEISRAASRNAGSSPTIPLSSLLLEEPLEPHPRHPQPVKIGGDVEEDTGDPRGELVEIGVLPPSLASAVETLDRDRLDCVARQPPVTPGGARARAPPGPGSRGVRS